MGCLVFQSFFGQVDVTADWSGVVFKVWFDVVDGRDVFQTLLLGLQFLVLGRLVEVDVDLGEINLKTILKEQKSTKKQAC